MLQRSFIALIVASGLVGTSAQGQTPVAWKFNKGDTFKYETVSTAKQTMKLLDEKGKPDGKEVKQDIEYAIVMSYTVLDAQADGSAVLECKVESMKFKNAGGSLGADDKVQGATYKLSLNAKRDAPKVEGYDAFIKKLAGEDQNALKTLRAVFPESMLMLSARQAFGFLPEKPEKTWTREYPASLGPLGEMTIKSVYKDEGPDTVNGKAMQKITFNSSISYTAPNAQAPAIAQSPFRVVKGELKGSDQNKGTIHFDAAAGRLVDSNQKVQLSGKMFLVISGTKVDAEINQDQTTKTTLVK